MHSLGRHGLSPRRGHSKIPRGAEDAVPTMLSGAGAVASTAAATKAMAAELIAWLKTRPFVPAAAAGH